MDKIFNKKNIFKILDYLGEGIQIIDRRGKIVYCNPAAAQLDNVNRDEAIGRHILEIYPSLTKETSTLLNAIERGDPTLNLQQTFVNYKGHKVTTINSSIPIIEDERILGALEISTDITHVRVLSEKLVDLQEKLYGENGGKRARGSGTAKYKFEDIIGKSEEMMWLKARAQKAADTLSSVIVYGNTGTGKELIVQSIHNASSRRNKPFVAQNCAAIPASLLESILFGTIKGSFTGADNRPGLFELANGGTLFLDEMNSMPIELQAKLLRVLQEGYIRRVGDLGVREVDVRIIAAMNMDPLEAVERQYLRNDLFYRLNVVSLRLPDLRERKEDIPLLVKHFIQRFNKKLGKEVSGVSVSVMQFFSRYDWPGNIRELEHVIEGAMNVLEGNEIQVGDLPHHLQSKQETNSSGSLRMVAGGSLREKLEEMERQLIEEALEQCNGNVTNAAQVLKIPRQTLQYKMSKYEEIERK